MLLRRDGTNKMLFLRMMFRIKTIITDHLEMLFRNMADKHLHEIHNGDSLSDEPVVFMSVVMESDIVTIVGIDTG